MKIYKKSKQDVFYEFNSFKMTLSQHFALRLVFTDREKSNEIYF